MGSRADLQEVLVDLLGTDQAYFQPPESVTMKYPCIVYRRDFIDVSHADNKPYKHKKRYLLTVIDRNPDSDLPDKVAMLPGIVYDRSFAADGLNHDVFRLLF